METVPPRAIAGAALRPPPVVTLIVNLVVVRLGAWARIKECDCSIPVFADGDEAARIRREAGAEGFGQRVELGDHVDIDAFMWAA
jgi:hypothetical protein